LPFQLINVEDSFFWWGARWQELDQILFDEHRVGFVVAEDKDEWDSVEAIGFTIAAYVATCKMVMTVSCWS
jgi:hypothetical protein